MEVIIKGKNRVEYFKIRKSDLRKHFFVTRGQMYEVYPDVMQKMEKWENKRLQSSETVIIYPENYTRPYGYSRYLEEERGFNPFDMDTIFARIDEHKFSYASSTGKAWRDYMRAGVDVWKYIRPLAPFVITGIILLLAFGGVLD